MRLGYQEVRKRLPGYRPGIHYVVPEANWSIDWDGSYITEGIRAQYSTEAKKSSNPRWLSGQIIHYGSLWSYLGNLGASHNDRNYLVATVFHGDKDSENERIKEGMELFLKHSRELKKIVVSNSIMEDRFHRWGISEEKIVAIPLGVDLKIFKPHDEVFKQKTRKQLSIAKDVFCVGSFQKDGDGWDEGLSPKLEKGPDIFIKAIEKFSENHKVHVLLSGPARGFVIKELDRIQIPYTHRLLEDYNQVGELYAALDAYLVSSREEGGPKGILESLASGIPLVSTKVGMAPDVIINGLDGLLSENEDAYSLAENLSKLASDKSLRNKLANNGLERVKQYKWQDISSQYYKKVYQPIIHSVIAA